jgi:hypothetical protein
MSSESIGPVRPIAGSVELPPMIGPAGVGRRDPKKNPEQRKRKREQPSEEQEAQPEQLEAQAEQPEGQPGDDESEPGPTVDCYG